MTGGTGNGPERGQAAAGTMDEAGAALDERDARALRRARWLVPLGTLLVRLLASTWRVRTLNPPAIRRGGATPPARVFTLWHGEMLPLLWQHRSQGIRIVISSHRDGEIIARIAHALGYQTIRGSTSKGATRALLEMARVLGEGHDIGVTPDGPRGPAHVFAPGALVAAQRAGAPLLLLRAHAARAWRLGSWDRFLIPKPFTRVTIAYELVPVTAASSRDASAMTDQFQAAMAALGDRAAG
jgi:lysophospholipid acyltransferase (LPLAT)-like uncharacterized protein